MIRKYYDKILLAITLVVLLAIFGYAAFRPDPQSIAEFIDIPALRPENTHTVSELPEIELATVRWEEPPAQSAGAEWVFDVFTPPVIHFNTRTEEFIIEGEPVAPPAPFEVELVSVGEELYRVQMIGWVGRAGDYLINLEDLETGELVLAREGRDYPDMDLSVRSFVIEKEMVPHAGGTRVEQDVARAVIFDKRLDREITLHSEFRKKDEEATAIFRASDGSGQEFRARSGDSFTFDQFTYTVDRLTPPASATVTRTGGADGDEPETKTLIAREGGDAGRSAQPDQEPADEDPEEAGADDTFDSEEEDIHF